MPNLVLISCSDKKKEGGSPFDVGSDPVPWLKDPKLRNRLFTTRAEVFTLIKANRLLDAEKRQGNRGVDPRNANLAKGPDLGGDALGAYLPACIRYDGRFFRTVRGTSSENELISRWRGIRPGYGVLIVSGLYGLVAPDDPIQEYTCHFADRVLGTETSLQLLWRELLTEIIRCQFQDGNGVLVDLLSEEAYQDAFDWAKIYGDTKCFHRAYKLKSGPETLINSARFFEEIFLGLDDKELILEPDRYYSKAYFDDPKEEILFEAELKTTKKEVAREGIQEVVPELKKRFGISWDILSGEVKKQIANSEYSYTKNRELRDFDFTAASICLSKAIEIWLETSVVRPLLTIPATMRLLVNPKGYPIPAGQATLGSIANFLSNVGEKAISDPWVRNDVVRLIPNMPARDYEKLSGDVRLVATRYRNGWAHKKIMPRALYEEYRKYAADFFVRWAKPAKEGPKRA